MPVVTGIDTALASPEDIVPWQGSLTVAGASYRAESRSVVLLFAGEDQKQHIEKV